jgi:hypothetical protein
VIYRTITMNFRLIIILSFACLLLSDMVEYMSTAMQLHIDATYITAVMRTVSLGCLVLLSFRLKWRALIPPRAIIYFKLLIAWNTITIIRGFFTAQDYWDWKYLILNTSFALWVPYAILVGVLFELSKDLFRLIITRLFLFGFIIIPLTLNIDTERELYSRGMMISVCFFILASPYFERKWQWLVFLVAATAIYFSYDFRTNVIRIFISLLIIVLFYTRKYVTGGLVKTICLIFFLAPIFFLTLGVTGQYNIFRPKGDDIEKYEFDYDNGKQSNIAIDTRTFLYEEMFSSMSKKNSFLLGEGAAATYKTDYFDDSVDQDKGRYGGEVGFLNTLLYSGIVGVLLYATMLFGAAYYAVNYSNNFLCKMLAIFLSFRWTLFFIEDYTGYNVNNYFIWVIAGLCFSRGFRAMPDSELLEYFNFSKKTAHDTVLVEKTVL